MLSALQRPTDISATIEINLQLSLINFAASRSLIPFSALGADAAMPRQVLIGPSSA